MLTPNDFERAIDVLQRLCVPFGYPDSYALADWHERASAIVFVCEYLELRGSERPEFCSEVPVCQVEMAPSEAVRELIGLQSALELETPARRERLEHASACLLDYRFLSREAVVDDRVTAELNSLPSVEKLAMSACARAIILHRPPLQIALKLCGIMRDECLHLLGFSRLLGVRPLSDGWITPERRDAWTQIVACESLIVHLLLEHCLFETEGAIAAAHSVCNARNNGYPAAAAELLTRVAIEELRHASVGYSLATLVCGRKTERARSSARALLLLREIEPLQSPSQVKGAKQRIAMRLLRRWSLDGNWCAIAAKLSELCTQITEGKIPKMRVTKKP